jgi:hypothetical protein
MKCSCGHDHSLNPDKTQEEHFNDELINVDIVAEMLLINEKKSKLSANQRREVEIRYNKFMETK